MSLMPTPHIAATEKEAEQLKAITDIENNTAKNFLIIFPHRLSSPF